MKKFKYCATLLVSLTILLSYLHVKAAMQYDDLPMEGELDDIGPRSVDPVLSLHAFLNENNVGIEFYKDIPKVTISIKDNNNNVIYTKVCFSPILEIISLAGFERGSYTLELRTETGGYMYGTFLYGY